MKSFLVRDVRGRRRRYKVEADHQVVGYCEVPEKRGERKDWTIYIDPTLRGMLHMETAIHELLHGIYPDWSEEVVDSEAKQIARFLWNLKYRRASS